jgi:hypothetical protein
MTTKLFISTHIPKTLEKLKEVVELSDGATIGAESYPTSLYIDILVDGDVEIMKEMISEKGLTIL